MFRTNLKVFVYLVILGFVLFPKEAHAYIDPGTGSYLFQFVIAGLLGSMFFFRGYFDKIKNKFSKNKKEETPKKADEKPTKTSKTKK